MNPYQGQHYEKGTRWQRYCLALSLWSGVIGCTSVSPVRGELDIDQVPMSRSSLQMYLVLTSQPSAMQTPGEVQGMWAAVHGTDPAYGEIRRALTWVPDDYRLDIELDFADLPHKAFPRGRLERLLRQLPASARRRASHAALGISVRSRGKTLNAAAQIRLVGAAALYIAERYQGVIIDLLARRVWTPAAWRAELTAQNLSSNQTRVVLRPRLGQLRTLGWLKFGLPDVVVTGVPESEISRIRAQMKTAWMTRLASGLHVGQPLMPSLAQPLKRCPKSLVLDGECVVTTY